jgi:glycosyl transferase family 87
VRLGSRGLLIAALSAATAFAAWERAIKQQVGTDFHVFWQAGYDFAHGLPLYQSLPGARSFNYPPFAAQIFQVFGILPLKLAAWLFYVASVALMVVAVGLSRRLVHPDERARASSLIPLVLGILFSAVFLLDNLDHLQVNLLTFVLCLLGIQAVILGREVAGAGWIVTATAIKLTPLFFIGWALIRGSRRILAAIVAFVGLTLALPMIQRGLGQGLLDLTTYYHHFLHKFAAGRVIANERNQNLAAMVYRATTQAADSLPSQGYGYAYLPSLEPAAPLIYRLLALAVATALVIHLIRLRVRHVPVGPLEITSVFLTSHLLSGITWKAHLVTMLFVFYVFFSLNWRRLSRPGLIALGVAWVGIAVIGLGRDLVGSRLHHNLAGYSVYVWVMLLLFVLSVVWSGRNSLLYRPFSRPSDRRSPCWTSVRDSPWPWD